MPEPLEVLFMPLSAAPAGAVLLLAGQELTLASVARGDGRAQQGCAHQGGPRCRFHRQGQDGDRGPGARRHRRPARDPDGNRQVAQGARPAAARRLRLRPDQCPQGRGRHAGGGARGSRRGERGGIRRGPGAGRAAQELQLPQVPHPQERGGRRGGEGARRFAQARRAVRQAGRRRQGIRGPQGRGGRRVPRPRPRQRAGQHAGPGRVCRADARAVRRRPRGRDLRRGSDARPQDGMRCWPWGRAASVPRAWWCCSGTAPSPSAPRRCASSARACASIPAASP